MVPDHQNFQEDYIKFLSLLLMCFVSYCVIMTVSSVHGYIELVQASEWHAGNYESIFTPKHRLISMEVQKLYSPIFQNYLHTFLFFSFFSFYYIQLHSSCLPVYMVINVSEGWLWDWNPFHFFFLLINGNSVYINVLCILLK